MGALPHFRPRPELLEPACAEEAVREARARPAPGLPRWVIVAGILAYCVVFWALIWLSVRGVSDWLRAPGSALW